ncbi:MAG: VacB/RNase II family 3'-5' exoribonuclease [Micavibrio aeruginosavorus]|uniref:Ribonuclease R n=1 Tax=Micavibrio aeruginosavorus TaxID=349221 RepID=A0A7T5R4G9_9BACT|nr:MAG: VacB/RNase II family 3'-5' exoribonuclease [Micavibrio aeruginosavorus]
MGRQNHRKNHGQSHHNHKGTAGHRGRGAAAKPAAGPVKVPDALVGVIGRDLSGRLVLNPCSKRDRQIYALDAAGMAGLGEGDIVLAKQGSQFLRNMPQAHAEKKLGHASDPGILSLISAHEKGLRTAFSQAALDETQGMTVPALQGRTDLRQVPLVTIDGADARDFDDAVFAEPTKDGYHLIVAIADVSWYVRPGTALDDEAYQRGNSTYFPDRVLPMLPEKLSNELCSLKPHEDRACIAAHLWIDSAGQLQKYSFERALMKSAARLTYDQVQAAKDGRPDAVTAPLMQDVIEPLYAAYDMLRKARDDRGAMKMDSREYKAIVDRNTGAVSGIARRSSADSHKLIEEFMILANVAAASALEAKNAPCVYRVHDKPVSAEKIEDLRTYLATMGINLPAGDADDPEFFNTTLDAASQTPYLAIVQDAILRVQAKAVYKTDNNGHFGLALERYAHFTSPIRRYADLLVHRSLVDQGGLGAGGLNAAQRQNLSKMAEHVSNTELASQYAERVSNDRFASAYLESSTGCKFSGTIQSVTAAGLFVQFNDIGAVGLVPLGALPKDRYRVDESTRSIVGARRVYRAGAAMDVCVVEADALKGALLLEPANGNSADFPGLSSGGSGRKARRGHSRSPD